MTLASESRYQAPLDTRRRILRAIIGRMEKGGGSRRRIKPALDIDALPTTPYKTSLPRAIIACP